MNIPRLLLPIGVYTSMIVVGVGIRAFSMPLALAGVWTIYDVSTIYFPLALLMWAARETIGGRRRRAIAASCIAATLVATRVYATHIEPKRLVVHRVRIETDKLSRPVRIAHISDIQSDGIGEWEKTALARVKALRPDLLVHTGDIIQVKPRERAAEELEKLGPLLEDIPAPLGRFNAEGDCDYLVADKLPTYAGFKTLENAEATIDLGGERIRLYGIGVYEAREPKKTARRVAKWRNADPDAFNIVFAHPPDFILGVDDQPIDLNLAGHTHGGQIRLPFIGPPVTLSEVPRKLARGFHEVGKTRLNTSAGIGAEHAHGLPSIRFNCPPEITLIEVVPKKRTASAKAGEPEGWQSMRSAAR